MKNNKLNPSFSCYHSYHSTQLSRLERRAEFSKTHCLPRKPVIFSLQHQNKSKEPFPFLSKQGYSVFSLEKISFERVKQQKQILDNARMPSFNIKKMFDNKEKRLKEKGGRSDSTDRKQDNSNEKDRDPRYDLKAFWNRYLQAEIMAPQITNQIETFNKTLGLIVNRSKQSKSQVTKGNSFQLSPNIPSDLIEQTPKKAESRDRTTFYVNNFIKTRYRKRNPSHPVQEQKHQASKKNIGQEFEEGYVVRPWQKFHDTEEDSLLPE